MRRRKGAPNHMLISERHIEDGTTSWSVQPPVRDQLLTPHRGKGSLNPLVTITGEEIRTKFAQLRQVDVPNAMCTVDEAQNL